VAGGVPGRSRAAEGRGQPLRAARPIKEDPALAGALDALIAGEPAVYGVVVAAPGSGVVYERNGGLPFVAASLYKLPVMAAAFGLAREGKLGFDEGLAVEGVGWMTVRDAVEAMITVSDNATALALIGRIGVEAVNRAAARLGLHHTRLGFDPALLARWKLLAVAGRGTPAAPSAAERAVGFVWAAAPAANGWPDVTTPRDMARFFGRLLAGEAVSRGASRRMLRLLGRQTVNDRFPVLLPEGTKVAHKTGNLPGVVHDAGVIHTPDGPVVLAVLAQDVPDEARATEVLQRSAWLVYDRFGGGAAGGRGCRWAVRGCRRAGG